MTASTVLLGLPRDATAALASAGGFERDKVVVRWKPVGSAPPVRHLRSKISATQKFEAVVLYLRNQLRVRDSESVFLYVNSTFAPALDEVVGNLHRVSEMPTASSSLEMRRSGEKGEGDFCADSSSQCFKDSNGELNVAYSITPAFG